MFNGMMDPELMRMAQEQMSRMSPADMARLQQQMMSNPELIKMASESMSNLRPEDLKRAAEQLKHTRPEDMAEIGERMAKASPEEIADMRAQMDGQISYQISAAEMLKKQGNDLHSQGQYKSALQKYIQAKKNLTDVPASKGRKLLLACSLNMMSCYLRTKEYDECVREGTEALASDPMNVKGLYRRGQAYRQLGQLEDAGSDLSKAHEVSPEDETIADVLRDAEERLTKDGGRRPSRQGLVIEEIVEDHDVPSKIKENSVKMPEEISRCDTSQTANFRTDNFDTLKDDSQKFRAFDDFISPETLSAGKVEGISPDMLKTASNMIGKMSPNEIQRMIQLASPLQGKNPDLQRGSIPSDLSPDVITAATDMMGEMSHEDLQKMFSMASSLKGNDVSSSSSIHANPGSAPPNMTPEMLKMASDMVAKMSPEERRKMFEIASSLRGQEGGAPSSSTATTSSNGIKLEDVKTKESLKVNGNGYSESSSSEGLNSSSSSSQSRLLDPNVDLQEQIRNRMEDPAMRQMLTSMMKNMSPDMMANMSEQFGLKLSREDAEKAQQAMSSLSPEALDSMMKWADRMQRGVQGAKKTKKFLLGRPGMILAIVILFLAVILHWFGFIGK